MSLFVYFSVDFRIKELLEGYYLLTVAFRDFWVSAH